MQNLSLVVPAPDSDAHVSPGLEFSFPAERRRKKASARNEDATRWRIDVLGADCSWSDDEASRLKDREPVSWDWEVQPKWDEREEEMRRDSPTSPKASRYSSPALPPSFPRSSSDRTISLVDGRLVV